MEYAWLIVPLLVLGLVLLLLSDHRSTNAAMIRRATSIERRLDALSARLRLAPPADDHAAVLAELQQGRKIAAIKVYREETGTGLAEAKAAVEDIARRYGLPNEAAKAPLSHRLARIERQIDALAAHHGVSTEEPVSPQVLAELRDGRKVRAIKLYREQTGADLVSAKNAVEEIARKHRI